MATDRPWWRVTQVVGEITVLAGAVVYLGYSKLLATIMLIVGLVVFLCGGAGEWWSQRRA